MILRNSMPTKTMQKVPALKSNKRPAVSSGKAMPDTKVNKKALKPNPLNGKAVAVPRWRGQLVAHVLIEALKALQLPTPVRKPKKHSRPIEYPSPLASYALCSGKYPQARQIHPSNTPHRGPLESISRPAGIPIAYIPRFPAFPMILISVAERLSRSAKEGAHAEKP
jgi:hypothetical protein